MVDVPIGRLGSGLSMMGSTVAQILGFYGGRALCAANSPVNTSLIFTITL